MNTDLVSRQRAAALVAVLLLHLLIAALLLRERAPLPREPGLLRTEIRLLALPQSAAPAPPPPPAALPPLPRLPRVPAETAIQLPAAEVAALTAGPPASAPLPGRAALPASAPAPLDLRLPTRVGPAPAPTLAEQMRNDPRANSPRESAAEQMAHAMGGAGWRSIELEDGGKKFLGPFGECFISRPSLVNQIPGHPHAGLVPNKVFGCGGIEKGSVKPRRPP